VADRRTALDKHLGLSERDSQYSSYRREALSNHVGEALDSENYAAAQVYALLLLGEKLEARPSEVTIGNSEELAVGIGSSLGPDLKYIADNIASAIS
jgi:hypothetical protein